MSSVDMSMSGVCMQTEHVEPTNGYTRSSCEGSCSGVHSRHEPTTIQSKHSGSQGIKDVPKLKITPSTPERSIEEIDTMTDSYEATV